MDRRPDPGITIPVNQEQKISRRPNRNHTPAFKWPWPALKVEKTLAELPQQHDVHPNQITQWKTQLLERAATVFGGGTGPAEPPVDITTLHTKIRALTLENDFLEIALHKAEAERQAMIDREHKLPPGKPRCWWSDGGGS